MVFRNDSDINMPTNNDILLMLQIRQIRKGQDMEEDILKIINHYGIDKQLKYIHSEYYELDEAILECEHSYNYSPTQLGRTYENHIAEEIADIMVMLKQFQYYYDISNEQIEKIMKGKVKRQLERIENEL